MGHLREKLDKARADYEELRRLDPKAALGKSYYSVSEQVFEDHLAAWGQAQYDLDVINDELIGPLSPQEVFHIYNRVLKRLCVQAGLVPFEAAMLAGPPTEPTT